MSDDKIAAATERLIASLGGSDWRVRRYNDDLKTDRIASLVAAVISDASLDGRATNVALWLSHRFYSPDLVMALIGVVRNRPGIARNAGDILAEKAFDEHALELESILLNATLPPDSRAGAARALGGLRGPSVSSALKRALLLPGQDIGVLDDAIQALAWSQLRSNTKDAAEDIAAFLKSDVPDIRYSALVALGNLGAEEVRDAIAMLLNDVAQTSRGTILKNEAARVLQLLNGE